MLCLSKLKVIGVQQDCQNKENTKVLIAIGKQFEKHLGFLPELEDVSLIGETLDELGFKEFFEDELKKKDERTSEEEKEEDFDREEKSQEDSQEGRQSQSSAVLESVKARNIWTADEVERAFGY